MCAKLSKVALSGTMKFRKFTKYMGLVSKARLAQWLPQRNELSRDRLSLACGFQQKKLTKLPGLSDSASLSHRHFSKRMTVHPQKMNSLSAIVALSEFIAFSRKNTKNELHFLLLLSL